MYLLVFVGIHDLVFVGIYGIRYGILVLLVCLRNKSPGEEESKAADNLFIKFHHNSVSSV